MLASQADGTVVIGGGLLDQLGVAAPPDEISPLDGMTLVKRKVRLLSAMAGKFSAGTAAERFQEYNVVTDLLGEKGLDWRTPRRSGLKCAYPPN